MNADADAVLEGLGANQRNDSEHDPRKEGSMVRSRVAEIERGAPGNQQAVSPAISGNNLDGYPIGDGGDARRRKAALRERQLKQGPHSDGFGSRVSRGGWQTPEKLQSLSKSKPIRTLDSIKRKKSKRGNKSKRRRKKTKGRRNKKKKQTKRKKNKGKRKKQTRKR
jgi:hypothetical protein